MALIQKIDSDFAYIFPKAYLKLENVRVNLEKDQVRMEVRGYADEAAREKDRKDKNIISIYKDVINCKLSDIKIKDFSKDGIKTVCYKYLKTLEIFKNAIDN